MTTTVVGLDPSLTGTGIATPTHQGTITTKPDDGTVDGRAARLATISATVLNHTPHGALVIIEGPAYSRQLGAGHHLRAGLWWLLVIELADHDCRIVEVAPTALKKFATGKGNATKADMRLAWFKRTGDDVTDDNQVDALWLRQVGLHLTCDPARIPLPEAQREALAKLRPLITTS